MLSNPARAETARVPTCVTYTGLSRGVNEISSWSVAPSKGSFPCNASGEVARLMNNAYATTPGCSTNLSKISFVLKGVSRKSGNRGVTKNEMTTGNPGHSRQGKLNRWPASLGSQLGRPRPRFCRVVHALAARLLSAKNAPQFAKPAAQTVPGYRMIFAGCSNTFSWQQKVNNT